MKKLLTAFFILISHCAFAAGWQENWALSRELIHKANYDDSLLNEALVYLNKAAEDPNASAIVYVDRAAILVYQKQYEKAEKDIDFALASDKLSEFDKPEAHHVKSRVCLFLNQEEGLEHFRIWMKTSKEVPEITETDTCAIVRNISADETTRAIYYQIYKVFGECNSLEDVTKIDNQTLMIKKNVENNEDCGCGCGGENKKKTNEQFQTKADGFFDDCHWCCDMSVWAGEGSCSLLPSWVCRVACMGLVFKWAPKCHSCCDSGSFYDQCVKPYHDLAKETAKTSCQCAAEVISLGWGFNEL